MKKIDMNGKTFNSLTVLAESGMYREHDTTWKCYCKCGRITIVRGSFLRSGHTKTCGNCNKFLYEGGYVRCIVGSGRSFIFDVDALEIVKSRLWSVDRHGYVLSGNGTTSVKLHRLLMIPSESEVVDHINGNPWDCRKKNLRVTSQRKNTYNQKLSSRNTTGYKGVCFDKRKRKYVAYIHPNRKFKFLGYYETPLQAAIAYNEAALFYFAEFAKLNVIEKEGVNIEEKVLALG